MYNGGVFSKAFYCCCCQFTVLLAYDSVFVHCTLFTTCQHTELVALHRYTIGMSHATYASSLAFISLAIADEL